MYFIGIDKHKEFSPLYFISKVCQDGDLRLIQGDINLSDQQGFSTGGQVELCINNTYGAVCDDFWDEVDATVACLQLGFSNGRDFLPF